jgi:hypothetical protein
MGRSVKKESAASGGESRFVATNSTIAQQLVFTTFVISGIIGTRLGGYPCVTEALPS